MGSSILLGLVGTGEDGQRDPSDKEGFVPMIRLVETIPKSLEELKIRDVCDDIFHQLFDLVQDKEKYAPSLKTILNGSVLSTQINLYHLDHLFILGLRRRKRKNF